MRPPLASVLLIIAGACAAADDDAPEVAGTDLRELVDLDPAPERFRAVLVAREGTAELLRGKPAAIWGYADGSDPDAAPTVPGPLIRVAQGVEIEIELRNELPEETTIHWHGVRLPADQDGTSASQIAVAPGESYTYRFAARDAGTFWYHPHVEADVQIERGLYAALIVEAPAAPPVAADRMFVLDDVKVDSDGRLSDQTDPLDLMLGRQGNVLLVNGRQRPRLDAVAGSRERWRFVNAANGRYFALQLPEATLTVIGSDGGMLPAPRTTDTLLIAPGERYELLVDFPADADALILRTVHYDRGHEIPDAGPQSLLDVALGDAGEAPGPLPESWGQIDPLPIDVDTPTRELVLSEDDADANNPIFFIDGAAFPEGAPIMVDEGSLEIWTLRNDAEMDHPFHIHGLFFQVLDDAGAVDLTLGWKDTVNVPKDASVRLAVRFDNPGEWMIHCHILEHAERGMMGMLHVQP